jgi:hypothetical protein
MVAEPRPLSQFLQNALGAASVERQSVIQITRDV